MMRLAMRMPERKATPAANDSDPRETMSAEIIDLASRNAFPAVARKAGKSDALGLAAGVAIVGLLGAITLWSMDTARVAQQSEGQPTAAVPVPAGNPAAAPTQPVNAQQPQIAAPAPQKDPAPQAVLANPPHAAVVPAGNPHASPTVVFDAGGMPVPLGIPEGAEAGKTGNSASDFASRIGGRSEEVV